MQAKAKPLEPAHKHACQKREDFEKNWFGFQVFSQLKVWCLCVSENDGSQESFSKDLIIRGCMLELGLFDVRKLGSGLGRHSAEASSNLEGLALIFPGGRAQCRCYAQDVEDPGIWDE